MAETADALGEVKVEPQLAFGSTLRGAKDVAVSGNNAWWQTRTPEGPASLLLKKTSNETVSCQAWGDGANWMINQAPLLLGKLDDLTGFAPEGELRRLWLKSQFKLARTDRLWDAMVRAVLGQKVQVQNAVRSRNLIAKTWGDPAPGPNAVPILPPPELVACLGYSDFHQIGVERKRADILIRVARELPRLESFINSGRSATQAKKRLEHIPGIGCWTSAVAAAIALGDADAVPVGDYHLPNTIGWHFAKQARSTDKEMLDHLEPYAGHRWRVIRLLKSSGGAPKFGPKLSLTGSGLDLGR